MDNRLELLPDELRGRLTLSVREVAPLLGVSEDVLYDEVKAGTVPSLTLGRRILIPVTKLLDLLGVEAVQSPNALDPATGLTPIDDLQLPPRAYGCLKREEIIDVATIVDWGRDGLMTIRNLGAGGVDAIAAALQRIHVELPDEGARQSLPAPTLETVALQYRIFYEREVARWGVGNVGTSIPDWIACALHAPLPEVHALLKQARATGLI